MSAVEEENRFLRVWTVQLRLYGQGRLLKDVT